MATKDLYGIDLARLCADLVSDKKAENVVILDVSKLTSYTDFLVVCSGSSERQVSAIANHLHDELKARGKRALGLEGVEEGTWVLSDYGDVIVHIFLDELRGYYNLEGFWADAPRVALEAVSKVS